LKVRKVCMSLYSPVFDEVITGFVWPTVAPRALWSEADLTCLGKSSVAGFCGAYGASVPSWKRWRLLECYQAGTLSGNPLAVTAGIQTLDLLNRRGFTWISRARLLSNRGDHEMRD